MNPHHQPPKLARRLLQWFVKEELLEEVEGDLQEKFQQQLGHGPIHQARRAYWYQVVKYARPFAMRRLPISLSIHTNMIRSYLQVGFRRIKRNKVYSVLNIGGLSVGLAVVMLIGLWVYEEFTYDHWHAHRDQVARVMQFKMRNGEQVTTRILPFPLGNELRENYGDNFEYVVMSSWTRDHVLGFEDQRVMKYGAFMEPQAPRLLDLRMIAGSLDGLREQNSILLSKGSATALFGSNDPIGQPLRVDNELNVFVTGVYEDLQGSFSDLEFIAPMVLYASSREWVREARTNWLNSAFTAYVKIADGHALEEVNERVTPAVVQNLPEWGRASANEVFLHPLSRWHLYSNWEHGVQVGGAIQNVWLFGGIGLFVLLLACINFINLSTAQSLKRTREVGIRKAIGSLKKQLVGQFLTESLLMVIASYTMALLMVCACLPYFGNIADKQLSIPLGEPWFWGGGMLVIGVTTLLAGGYPSFFLSGFRAVQAIKGAQHQGAASHMLRKGLVVVQFTISVVLIIGTLAVKDQVAHSQNRPMGYDVNHLLAVDMVSDDYRDQFEVLHTQLMDLRAITSMAMVSSPMTRAKSRVGGFDWEGKDPDLDAELAVVWIHPDFGKTVGWQVLQGRDFSRDVATDSAAFVINQAACRFMALEDPIGQTIDVGDDAFHVIGVVKDIVRESPYEQVKPMVYLLNPTEDLLEQYLLRLNPEISFSEATTAIESVFGELAPNIPFDYQLVDQRYAVKFRNELRISKICSIFSGLAIFISCLGLFGLASYTAEQRTREVGIRKVLGASISNLWRMLSWQFLVIILLASAVAVPIAYYAIDSWLSNYAYRIGLPWYAFLYAIVGAVVLTLLTVSFQTLKVALSNPVDSLRSE